MLETQFVLLIIYILGVYLFDKLRLALTVVTLGVGLVFLLNEWDNTVVPDSTVKLSFILSFLMYSMMIIFNISKEEI